MADGVERTAKFRDAALVLADDAVELAARIRKQIRQAKYSAAEVTTNELQKTARDAKWLMRRQPKE